MCNKLILQFACAAVWTTTCTFDRALLENTSVSQWKAFWVRQRSQRCSESWTLLQAWASHRSVNKKTAIWVSSRFKHRCESRSRGLLSNLWRYFLICVSLSSGFGLTAALMGRNSRKSERVSLCVYVYVCAAVGRGGYVSVCIFFFFRSWVGRVRGRIEPLLWPSN